MTFKLVAGLVAGIAATTAIAQVPTGGFAPRQGDGVQTRAQVVQRVQTMFGRLDRNRDGVLTQQEARAAAQQVRGQFGQRAANPALRQQRSAQAFARHDINRDGVISRSEFEQVRAQRAGRRQTGQRLGGGGASRLFAMADANRDGRVTLQEATGSALQRFDAADRNRDGVLTPAERQQARGQWGMGRRG